jgi:rare lipoprotein A (peptidoglycan hydrolase)
MIARATLALILACPAAAGVLATSHRAEAGIRDESQGVPNVRAKRSKAAGTSATNRVRGLVHHTVLRTWRRDATFAPVPFDDGLAYDTPRGPDGRPLASTVAMPIPLAYFAPGRLTQIGIASWYGGPRWQGHATSDGGCYDENRMTAAHASLPFGTKVRVRLIGSDREVIVTITDRPGTRRRIIDLSRSAAAALGILSRGTAEVSLEPVW